MQLYKIKDIGKVVGGATPRSDKEINFGGDIPWITPRDLSGHDSIYIKKGSRNLSGTGLKSCSAVLMPKGTVLFSSRAPIGYVAIADNDITTNQGFKSIICDDDKVNNLYLYYYLKLNKERIESVAVGSTFKEVSKGTLENFEISIHEKVEEQKQIAEILSSLDDKIELNRQINANLERLVSALFKHWFVDESIARDKWESKPLDKVADFLNGLALQKHPVLDGEVYLPVVKIRELKSGISDSTDKASANIPSEYILKDGDVVFSWSGSLEEVIWCNGRGALNQHLFKVTSDRYEKWFYYLWIKHHLRSFKSIASDKAVTMGHIKRGHLSEAMVLIPDDETLQKMDDTMRPIIDLIISNSVENRRLATLRDSLLPRLMSGKLRT